MPNKLHFYTKISKEKIKLSSKPIASGGEGALYPVASPRAYKNLVVKIYHPDKRDAEREAKMKYLIQNPPIVTPKNQHQPIAWVLDLIYQNNKFVGILMHKIKGKKLTKLTLSKLSRKAGIDWKRFAFGQPDALKLRLRTCFNIAIVIHQIHASEHYVLVDLKPDNIMMQPNGLIAIVDMDSVEVIENGRAIFPAPVATPEYTPPEHYTEKRRTIAETWDRFGLGVIFYQLLFGLHPFAASANPPYDVLVSLDEKIKQGLYVHIKKSEQVFKVVPPPHKRFHETPLELQQLFQKCFEKGHSFPNARPSALEWCIVLARLLDLPFNHFPNLIIPPSDLYHLPSSFIHFTNLNKQLPKSLEETPTFLDLTSHLETNSLVATTETKLQDQYRLYIENNRQTLKAGLFFILLSVATVYWFQPLMTLLGLVFLILLVYQIFIVKNKNTINLIKKNTTINKNKITISNVESLKKDISKTHKELEQLKDKNNTSRSKFAQNDLDFIEQYVKRRESFKTRINDLKEWAEEADKETKFAREIELEAYKKEGSKFQESLEKHPLFEKYDFYSYSKLKAQLELTIENQKATLEEINKQTHVGLKEQQTKKIERLNYDFAVDLSIYKKKRQNEAIIAWRKLVKRKNTPRDIEDDYALFSQKLKQLKIRINNEREKIDKLTQKSFLQVRKDLRLNSEQELNKFIELLDSISEEDDYEKMQLVVSKKLKGFVKQLRQLQIGNNPHIKQVSANLDSFDTKPPLFKKKVRLDYNSINDLCTAMIHARKEVEKELEILGTDIQKLVDNPDKIISNPIDISYWRSAVKKQVSRVQFNLEQHLKLQKQFFIHSIIFELKVHLKRHDTVIADVEQKYQDLEKKEAKDMDRLMKKHKDAIEYYSDIDEYNKNLKDNVISKEKKLQEDALKSDIAAFKKELKNKLECNIEKSKAHFNKILEARENKIKDKRNRASASLEETTKALEELHLLHSKFEKKISPIRDRAEIVYTKNKKLAESKRKELEDLLLIINEEHKKASQFFITQRPNYKNILKQEKNYKKALEVYENLNAQKIEIETLLNLEKNYSHKIFIKDLLLNRVEQFDKKDTK